MPRGATQSGAGVDLRHNVLLATHAMTYKQVHNLGRCRVLFLVRHLSQESEERQMRQCNAV